VVVVTVVKGAGVAESGLVVPELAAVAVDVVELVVLGAARAAPLEAQLVDAPSAMARIPPAARNFRGNSHEA
jgi:hypothetical protein